jgi:hypothetical protein
MKRCKRSTSPITTKKSLRCLRVLHGCRLMTLSQPGVHTLNQHPMSQHLVKIHQMWSRRKMSRLMRRFVCQQSLQSLRRRSRSRHRSKATRRPHRKYLLHLLRGMRRLHLRRRRSSSTHRCGASTHLHRSGCPQSLPLRRRFRHSFHLTEKSQRRLNLRSSPCLCRRLLQNLQMKSSWRWSQCLRFLRGRMVKRPQGS